MKNKAISVLAIIIAAATLLWVVDVTTASPPVRPLWQSGAPTVVSYQGYVEVSGSAHNGNGYFKFAVVDAAGTTSYWSNDGTSTTGNEPTAAITLTVSSGLFNVLLGDTSLGGMTQTLDASVFDGTDRYLRVWFSADGSTFNLLSPDRRVAAVPYALQATSADTLDSLDSGDFWQLGGNAGTISDTHYLGTSNAVSLTLAVSGTEAIRIDTAGNVGLGTDSPTEKLTLAEGDFLQTPGDPIHAGAISDNGTTELSGASGIYVVGDYAYVTAYNDSGVEVLDISDPTNPSHVGAISDNGTTALQGADTIFVVGNYAYVKAGGLPGEDGVEVLDISDPTNPTHVGAIFDDGTTELDGGGGIYVVGHYAYVAAIDDDGVEVLDISDPSNPTHVGAITDDGTTELDGANSIYVVGNYAYVTAYIDDGVEVLDISDPTNPTHVGAITDDGTTALDGARHIYIVGRYAYVTADKDNGVEVLDISDPANPTHVGAIFDDGSMVLNGTGIHVAGNYAYVAAYEDDGVAVLDISDPGNPTYLGAITDDGTTALDGAWDIYVVGNYAYVTAYQDNGVEVLDITGITAPAASIGAVAAGSLHVSENAQVGHNLTVHGGLNVGPGGALVGGDLDVAEGDLSQTPGAPTYVGVIFDDGTAKLRGGRDIVVVGEKAYVASNLDQGVEILDISDPGNPTHLGAVGNGYNHGIYVAGNYAYVSSTDMVDIFDISDPSSPTRVGRIIDFGSRRLSNPTGIFVVGNYAYVASWFDDAVAVLDVSDPTNPGYMGHIVDDGTTELNGARDIYVVGNYAYVAAEDDDGLEILDISDPGNPSHVSAITDTADTALNGAYGIFVAGNYAYVAASVDDGVAVIDISDPNNPVHMGSIFDDDTMALDGARNIFVVGDYAYVTAHEEDGIAMLDISDPGNPTHVASIFDDSTMALDGAHGIYIAGQYAYVTGRLDHGVTVFDISGVTAPAASLGLVEAGTLQVTGHAQVGQNLIVQGGLNVGPGGAQIGGDLSVQGTLFAPVNVTSRTGGTLEIIEAGVVLVDNASSTTITLPDAAETTGLIFTIKNINTGAVTVATAGENIDGAASQSLAAQYDFITVVSDGTNWFIISQ